MSETVFVTNKSESKLVFTYEYKQIEFPIGKPVEISLKAAKFIFGHGVTDKEPILARLGWIRLHSELEQGLEKLAKFVITDQPFISEDRSLPSAVGVVPLHVEKRAGGKANQRAA
jgi:hypothetical protein